MKDILRSRAARNRILAAIVLTALVVLGGWPAWLFAVVVVLVWVIVERYEVARAFGLDAVSGWAGRGAFGNWVVRANDRFAARMEVIDASLREPRVATVVYRVAALLWAAVCLGYIFSGRPPYEFFADIGRSINALGRMGAVVTNPQSLLALFGWQTWNDAPNFVLFPNGTLYAALPFELILRDPFRTIKLVQAIQLTAAFFGAAWLYASMFGKSRWCWLAGWTYAAMPFCTLAVRGDVDVGSIFATIPIVLACNIALARRFGARSLPLAALVCSIVGAAFSAEYLLTVGVPLLLATIILFRRENVRFGPASLCAAAIAFVVFPAYVLLPTLLGTHPVSLSDSYLAGLKSRTQLPLFSQGFFEQIAGSARENLLSENKLLDASRSLPLALVSGCIAWILLGTAVVHSSLAGARWWWPIAALAIVWTALSFGPSLPLVGTPLWNLIAATPSVNVAMTPDRFAQFDGILLALAATYGASILGRRGSRWLPAAALVTAALVAGYLFFDLNESVLGFGTMDLRLPNQADVSRASREIGGRSVVLALPRDGSPFDSPPYAPLRPTLSYAWDLAARYADTDGGAGLLRRAAVRSIVTSPAWTQATVNGVPADMTSVVQKSSVVTVASPFPTPFVFVATGVPLPASARVFSVKSPREILGAVVPVCAYAGPAAFELAASDRRFDSVALVHGPHAGCAATLRADYDVMDETVPAAAIATWSGGEAFGLQSDLASDSSLELDRFVLTASWFRYAYSGDSVLSTHPFNAGGSATSRSLRYVIAHPGNYDAYVRVAGVGTISAVDGKGAIVAGDSQRASGFSWLKLPLGELKAGSHVLRLQVSRPGEPAEPMVIDEEVIAADLVAVPPTAATDALLLSSREFAPPMQSSDRELRWIFPRLEDGWPTSIGQRADVDGQTTIGVFDGVPGIRSAATSTRIRFRWSGATGRYAGGVAAWLAGEGSTIAVSATGKTFSAADDGQGAVPTSAFGVLDLQQGQPIDVSMTSVNASAATPNELVDLLFVPVQSEEAATDYDTKGETWRFNSGNTVALFEGLHNPESSLRANAVVAPVDSVGVIRFRPDFDRGTVKARIDASGRLGSAFLECGGDVSHAEFGTSTLSPGGVDLVLVRRGNDACELRITWISSDFAVRGVVLQAEGGTLAGWSSLQYFAAGTYEWSSANERRVLLTVDGVNWAAERELRLAAGPHKLVLFRAPNPVRPIFIRNAATWTAPAMRRATTLELAQLSDGNWYADVGGKRSPGYACDLVNTCFDEISRGDTPVRHALPSSLAWGSILTAFDVVACLGFLGLRTKRKVKHDG